MKTRKDRFGVWAFGAGVAFLAGCSTLPDKAPMEFSQAKAEIESADKEDVENYFPKTLDRAQQTLNHAVKLFNQSDRYIDPNSIAAKKQEAIAEANQAQMLAANAREAHRKLKAWDANINSFVEAEQTSAMARDMELTLLGRPQGTMYGKHGIHSGSDRADMRTGGASGQQDTTRTVAHFSTGSAKLGPESRLELERIAEQLKKNPDLKVEVLAYADSRGSDEKNRQLSEKRAQAVAQTLKSFGITEDRIQTVPLGEQYSLDTVKNAGRLQLDRRVDVRMFAGSGQPGTERQTGAAE